jgi:MFS family permease
VAKAKKQKTIIKLLGINAFMTFGWGIFAPFVVIIGQSQGLSVKDAGFAWGFYSLLTGIIMLIMGKFEDGAQRHGLMSFIGICLLVLGSVAGYTIDSIYPALALYAFGFGIAMPAFKVLYSKSQIRGNEAAEWSWMDGGNMLLMSGAAFIAAVIVQNYDPKVLYLATLPFFIFAAIVSARLFSIIRKIDRKR